MGNEYVFISGCCIPIKTSSKLLRIWQTNHITSFPLNAIIHLALLSTQWQLHGNLGFPTKTLFCNFVEWNIDIYKWYSDSCLDTSPHGHRWYSFMQFSTPYKNGGFRLAFWYNDSPVLHIMYGMWQNNIIWRLKICLRFIRLKTSTDRCCRTFRRRIFRQIHHHITNTRLIYDQILACEIFWAVKFLDS